MAARRNVIRVLDDPQWKMCTNIEWQTCLVTGALPGQDGNAAEFAKAPKELTLDEFRRPPAFTSCWAGGTGDCYRGFATSDVFYFEVCFFNHVCRNRDTLFRVDAGETFRCDFDEQAWLELQQLLW